MQIIFIKLRNIKNQFVELLKISVMKKRFHILLVSIFLFGMLGCTQAQSSKDLGVRDDRISKTRKKVPDNVVTSYECMQDGTGFSDFINIANMVKSGSIEMTGVEVTDEEESTFGDEYYETMKSSGEYTFIENGAMLESLTKMLENLLWCRATPTGITYKIHLLKDDVVNAYTAGGHVYMTTGIIDYCETISEIAFIIGHEIGHNEKGHLKLMLKELKVARGIAGDFGDMAVAMQKFLTPSFNQLNEVEVDCYGADLAYAAGYDPCEGIKVWKRMSQEEGEYDVFNNFFRSHPYSTVRYDCLMSPINYNYALKCD